MFLKITKNLFWNIKVGTDGCIFVKALNGPKKDGAKEEPKTLSLGAINLYEIID